MTVDGVLASSDVRRHIVDVGNPTGYSRVLLSAWAWWVLLAARERLSQSLAAPVPAPAPV